jgi:predicted small lipoprotein YifL
MSKFIRFVSTAAAVALLSACGAKGPLFLPEKPVPDQQEVPEEMMPTDPVEAPPADDSTPPVETPVETPVPPANGGSR